MYEHEPTRAHAILAEDRLALWPTAADGSRRLKEGRGVYRDTPPDLVARRGQRMFRLTPAGTLHPAASLIAVEASPH